MTKSRLQLIPKNVNRIQFNRCYNPQCSYFLVAPTEQQKINSFKVLSVAAGTSSLKCVGCGKTVTLKSNESIHQELNRVSKPASYIDTPVHNDACKTSECENFNKKSSYNPTLYKRNGRTATGNQRYSCKSCQKSFTHVVVKEKRKPNTRVEIEKTLFREMVNKTPVRGSISVFEMSPQTYYEKMDRFAKKCALFTYNKEKRLKELTRGKRFNLCTDKQDYTLNWIDRKNKVNTILNGIGTADLWSGYVFGMNINFDPLANMPELLMLEESTSAKYKQHFRKYAHLWMPRDTLLAQGSLKHIRLLQKELNELNLTGLERSIMESERMNEISSEIGIILSDASDGWSDAVTGTRVHFEYMTYAHFLWLAKKFFNAKKVNFYLDQDPAMDRAVLNSFSKNNFKGELDAFSVKIDKGIHSSVDKENLKKDSDFFIHEIMENEQISYYEAQKKLILNKLAAPRVEDKFITINGKEWLKIPYSEIKEPEKMVHWITKRDLPIDKQASMFHNASLHAIDRFFNITREKISTLARPSSSQGSVGRIFNKNSSYSPIAVEKKLIMLKTFRNYIQVGQDGKTPAMRIGLADKPYDVSQIIHR